MTRRLYGGKDFETLKNEVKSRLSKRFSDISLDFKNDLTVFILEMITYGVEPLNFFLDVKANESFVATAQQRSSMERLAAESGYNPPGAVSASGELRLRPVGHNRAVTLERGFQLSSTKGLVYEVVEDYFWPAGDETFKEITLSERETKTASFVSDGSRFQQFELPLSEDGEYLSYRSVEVLVDGETWEEVDQFSDLDTSAFRVGYTSSKPYIEFGDGAVGEIPQEGGEIRVTYAINHGKEGTIPAGLITGPVEPLIVAGEAVELEIDEETGEMKGGDGPESMELIRSKLPHFRHADGAIVTNPDVKGLLDSFKDPIYGAVAAATAFVAKSIDNDVTSARLITESKSILLDAGNIIDGVISALSNRANSVDDHLSALQTLLSDIEGLVGPEGTSSDLDGLLGDIRTYQSAAVDASNSADQSAKTIQSTSSISKVAIQEAQDSSSSIRGTIGAIDTGSSNQLTGTIKTELTDLLDDLDDSLSEALAMASTGTVVQEQTQKIVSSIGSIKDQLSLIKSRVDSADEVLVDAGSKMDDVSLTHDLIADDVEAFRGQGEVLSTQIVAPWDESTARMEELWSHLDKVFSDACGPNLVTIPILSYDADGFYVSPSIGLMRSLESYISERKEPSVVVVVTDGSDQLVEPVMSVVFRVGRGYSANTIKGAIESSLFSVLKDRDFGQDLYLDDLYNSLRSIEGVEYLNISIDNYLPFPQSGVSIDDEGNLVLPEGKVVTKPDVTYYVKLQDGSKEQI